MEAVNWGTLYREFVTLAVVIDPIGTIPVFMATTASMSAALRRKVALRAVLTAGGVLYFFLVFGQILFETLGLALGTFQIAGGIVLFLFALTMIFGESKTEREVAEAEASARHSAVYPLAIPSIASPGAMLAVIILTDNHRHGIPEQAITAGLIFVVLLITLVLLLLAVPIQRLIGKSGASVISRVMGIILSTVAVDSILNGFSELGVINFEG
ncbi:MAG: MarC family protein [Rhodobiaceae bacterium]|nr:MarC family protein [Rhodobiaceae bacterium]